MDARKKVRSTAAVRRANCPFEFDKRGQPFIGTHNETLPVVAMCVCNPDLSPVGINRWDPAPTPLIQTHRAQGRFQGVVNSGRAKSSAILTIWGAFYSFLNFMQAADFS
jgi:hypothetical protein